MNLNLLKYYWMQVKYRDLITHSYYAMFSASKALLLTKDYTVKSHEGLVRVFGREFIRDGDFDSEIFGYLTDARAMRRDTSYDSLAVFYKKYPNLHSLIEIIILITTIEKSNHSAVKY